MSLSATSTVTQSLPWDTYICACYLRSDLLWCLNYSWFILWVCLPYMWFWILLLLLWWQCSWYTFGLKVTVSFPPERISDVCTKPTLQTKPIHSEWGWSEHSFQNFTTFLNKNHAGDAASRYQRLPTETVPTPLYISDQILSRMRTVAFN